MKYLILLFLLIPKLSFAQKPPNPEYRNGEWKCPPGYEFRQEGDVRRCTLSLTAPAPSMPKRTFDKKYVLLSAGTIASAFLANKGIADCRREFGPENCSGGSGPSFEAREGLRYGTAVGADVLSFIMKRSYERGSSSPVAKLWWLPQVAFSAWNVGTFMRNDPDVAQWRKGIGKD